MPNEGMLAAFSAIYVTIRSHGVFVLVVTLLAVVGKRGDVESFVLLERMRRQPLMHDFVSGFKIR
ncbi:MAG: hypothetical protein U0103_13850 [Candidatus Obscuribacterales bacterium]